jgi:2-polyprenyl-3-methyl-5-hydroxy-6-metoxy-1,4-benzoquinol methylase
MAANGVIHRLQGSIRRAGPLLKRAGFLAQQTHARQGYEGEELERFLEGGRREASRIASDIEIHTGAGTLEGRTALDYGCGPGRLALPLAEQCEHVYGLDVTSDMLAAAARNAQRKGVENVEWLRADALAGLAGRYDLVISMWVFQHIPSREGERVFSQLVQGLRPGGVGAINMTLRPSHPWRGLVRGILALDREYVYQLIHSYSLNRVGEMLVDAGINDWYARWQAKRGGELIETRARRRHPTITIVFRKP